ncbi:hypothetical protein ACWIG5_42415, partial [Streptomyces lydicus]
MLEKFNRSGPSVNRLFAPFRRVRDVRMRPERVLPQPRGRGWRGRPWQDYALFLVLVVPNLALLTLFVYRPLIDNIRLSFYDWNISDPVATFIGVENYREWWGRTDSW